MKRLSLILVALFNCSVQAQDTETTVLGLVLPEGDAQVASNQLASLISYWPSSQTGVSIKMATVGIPLQFVIPVTGDAQADMDLAMATVGPIRDQYGADIVLFFGGFLTVEDPETGEQINVCGRANQENWLGFGAPKWDPNGAGLDLNGSEDGFVAIISTDIACGFSFTVTPIHEYGHLHGAGHFDPDAIGYYLNDDSRAYHVDTGFVAFKTIMAEGGLSGTQTFVFSTYWSSPAFVDRL